MSLLLAGKSETCHHIKNPAVKHWFAFRQKNHSGVLKLSYLNKQHNVTVVVIEVNNDDINCIIDSSCT